MILFELSPVDASGRPVYARACEECQFLVSPCYVECPFSYELNTKFFFSVDLSLICSFTLNTTNTDSFLTRYAYCKYMSEIAANES